MEKQIITQEPNPQTITSDKTILLADIERWKEEYEKLWKIHDSYKIMQDEEYNKLKDALTQIANPIAYMQSQLKEGERLDGGYAVMLSQDANYLKQIAIKALTNEG